MAQFPFFRDIAGVKALVVGGGEVALRRARMLAEAGAEVSAVSPDFCEGFLQSEIVCIRRSFEMRDLDGAAMVVAATDDRAVNSAISEECSRRGIEINVSDAPQECSFQFPSLVRRGPLTIGISTGGASPVAAKYVRRRIESVIPERFEAILSCMEMARGIVRKHIGGARMRAEALKQVFEHCLTADDIPDEQTLEEMIRCLQRAETH